MRNCFNNTIKSFRELIKLTQKDVTGLLKAISEYHSRFSDTKLPIVVYYPKYQIPDEHRRVPPKSQELLWESHVNLIKGSANYNVTNVNDTVDIIECTLGNSGSPIIYRELAQIAKRIGGEYSNIRNMFMLSSIPMDWHMYRYLDTLSNKGFRLIESYTAQIHTPLEFNNKVFGNEYVPFTPYTHLVLGDKVLIEPMVKRNDKKDFIELAKKDKWNWKSHDIVNNLIESQFKLSSKLQL
jgi:hypothetical protein